MLTWFFAPFDEVPFRIKEYRKRTAPSAARRMTGSLPCYRGCVVAHPYYFNGFAVTMVYLYYERPICWPGTSMQVDASLLKQTSPFAGFTSLLTLLTGKLFAPQMPYRFR